MAKKIFKVAGIGAGAFAAVFAVYFFNIDMKLTAAIEPILLNHYDRIERNQYI